MNVHEGLGFSRLSQNEKYAYKIVLKAFSALDTSFDGSQIGRGIDIMKIINVALGDNPNIIYFNKTYLSVVTSRLGKKIQLSGCPSRSQIIAMNSELENKANSIISSLFRSGDDEYTLLIKIYEYIQNTVRYDKQEFVDSARGRSTRPLSHNAYGALINKLAVCDGFSSAFTLLSQKSGFECMQVTGRSTYGSNGPVDHAWNIIQCRNNYYHMDATWDTNQCAERGAFSYDYFALTNKEIANDHTWNVGTTPVCSSNDLSYYLRNGLYAGNAYQMMDIFRVAVKNRKVPLRIKLSSALALPQNAGKYLAQSLLKEATRAGGSAQVNYGWNEHTRCFFARFL